MDPTPIAASPPAMITLAAMADEPALDGNKLLVDAPPRTDSPQGTASGYTSSEADSTDAPSAVASDMKGKTLRELIAPRFWSTVVLAALAASAPLVMSTTVIIVALHRLFFRTSAVPWNGKTAIISGGKMTKAFIVAKALKKQGCRVVLVETSKYWMVASRFSNAVDRFVTVPIPEKHPEAHLAAVAKLAEEEKADLYVPVTSPVASQYESRLHEVLPPRCFCWSLPSDQCCMLDDKVVFCNSAAELGLSVPASHRICSHDDVRAFNEKLHAERAAHPQGKHEKFIFKNLQYDSMHRLDLFTLPCAPAKLDAYLADIFIDEANPWTVQTFITGNEYCGGGVFKDGKILAFADNEASISCFNYEPARLPKIRAWLETYVSARKLSGIACFDFIVEADGTPYAIECNPRASSNLATFYNSPGLGAVLCNPHEPPYENAVEPLPSVVETYWLFSEAMGAVKAIRQAGVAKAPYVAAQRAAALLSTVLLKKDAYFTYDDPLPFLALLYVHIPVLLLRNLVTGNKWAKIDPCIGKMTEENGD